MCCSLDRYPWRKKTRTGTWVLSKSVSSNILDRGHQHASKAFKTLSVLMCLSLNLGYMYFVFSVPSLRTGRTRGGWSPTNRPIPRGLHRGVYTSEKKILDQEMWQSAENQGRLLYILLVRTSIPILGGKQQKKPGRCEGGGVHRKKKKNKGKSGNK